MDPTAASSRHVPRWPSAAQCSKVSSFVEVRSYKRETNLLTAPSSEGRGPRMDLGSIRWDEVRPWDAPLNQPQPALNPEPRSEEGQPRQEEDIASGDNQQAEANTVKQSGRASCDNSSKLLVAHGGVNGQPARILISGGQPCAQLWSMDPRWRSAWQENNGSHNSAVPKVSARSENCSDLSG